MKGERVPFESESHCRCCGGIADHADFVPEHEETCFKIAAGRMRRFAEERWKGTFGGGWTPDGRDNFWEQLIRGAFEDFRQPSGSQSGDPR